MTRERVRVLMRRYQADLVYARERYDVSLAAAAAELRWIQADCKHPHTTFVSGTPYDKGVYVCDDCEKELP